MKHKITGQLVKKNGRYIAVWLVDGRKHCRSLGTDDQKVAKEKYDRIMELIRNHYDNK